MSEKDPYAQRRKNETKEGLGGPNVKTPDKKEIPDLAAAKKKISRKSRV